MAVAKPLPKILIVDDEPDILELVTFILEETAEWHVVSATNGDEAITVARREQPDVILLDGHMPGRDGVSTLAGLRSDPVTHATPVILITASLRRADRTIPPGFSGVIAKPFDPVALPQQIRGFLTSPAQAPRESASYHTPSSVTGSSTKLA